MPFCWRACRAMTKRILDLAPNQSPRLLSPKETAARISASYRTLQRWIDLGTFPSPVKIGGQRIAFYEDEVTAWIAALPRVRNAA